MSDKIPLAEVREERDALWAMIYELRAEVERLRAEIERLRHPAESVSLNNQQVRYLEWRAAVEAHHGTMFPNSDPDYRCPECGLGDVSQT